MTYIFWILCIYLTVRIGKKKQWLNEIRPSDAGVAIVIINFALDFFVWVVAMRMAPYFTLAAPWVGYILLYFITKLIFEREMGLNQQNANE